MADATKRDRDPTTGHFIKGKNDGPGRPKGSGRKQLAREFIEGMQKAWEEHGQSVLERVIEDDPATFLRSMVAVMPKELDLTVTR